MIHLIEVKTWPALGLQIDWFWRSGLVYGNLSSLQNIGGPLLVWFNGPIVKWVLLWWSGRAYLAQSDTCCGVCWTGGYILRPREWAGLGHVLLSRPGPLALYLQATSTMKCKKRCKWLVGFAESSFLLVVVELNRTMFNYHAALWPREMKFGSERWTKAVSTIYWIGKVKKKKKKKKSLMWFASCYIIISCFCYRTTLLK